MKNVTVTYYAEGKLEGSNEVVKGILTILGADFEHIPKGFYLGNAKNSPFAYKVDPDSVIILGDHIASLFS